MISSTAVTLLSLSLLITFVFSIGEKIVDISSYQNWLKEHFKNTFVLPILNLLFYLIIILELISSMLLLYGLYELNRFENFQFVYIGGIASFMCFLILLIGQRIAKDYQSTANLMIYILVSIASIYLSEMAL
jgi:putative oxidoreductase